MHMQETAMIVEVHICLTMYTHECKFLNVIKNLDCDNSSVFKVIDLIEVFFMSIIKIEMEKGL